MIWLLKQQGSSAVALQELLIHVYLKVETAAGKNSLTSGSICSCSGAFDPITTVVLWLRMYFQSQW